MKFYLIVAKGKKQGMPIPITIDLFLLGSDKMCQLRNPNLGPKQCAFVTRDKKVFIRDFDSGHVTEVNGSVIPPGEEWPLHGGDRIAVGNLEFMIQYREKPLSQRDLEEWAARCLPFASARGFPEFVAFAEIADRPPRSRSQAITPTQRPPSSTSFQAKYSL